MACCLTWRHHTITRTNVDLSSIWTLSNHLRISSLEDLKIPISKARLKIKFLKSHQDLPGPANKLMESLWPAPVRPSAYTYLASDYHQDNKSFTSLQILYTRWLGESRSVIRRWAEIMVQTRLFVETKIVDFFTTIWYINHSIHFKLLFALFDKLWGLQRCWSRSGSPRTLKWLQLVLSWWHMPIIWTKIPTV